MEILFNTGGIASTNSFLIADESTGKAVLFDAPDHTVTPLLDEAQKRGWDIIGLWLTHGHFDHVADHALVTQRFPNAKVLIHRLDEPKLIKPPSIFLRASQPFTIPPRHADGYVEDEQKLTIGNLSLEVLFTPGHSPGHVCYHFPGEKVLVGGDLIIMQSIGRYDLPDSNVTDLVHSIQRVMALDPQTRLLCGHGEESTLAREQEENEAVGEIVARVGS